MDNPTLTANISLEITRNSDISYNVAKNLSVENFRESVESLQGSMLQMEDKVESPLTHHFAPGLYGREIFLEKGLCIIGKIHKHAHLNVISKGHVFVVTEFGKDTYRAPITFVSKPGTKRCVYAFEDTIWTTIHTADSEDLDDIEKDVIAESYEELNEFLRLEGIAP